MAAPKPAWLRPAASIAAWAGVTAVAIVVTWLGLSAVFASAGQRPGSEVYVADAAFDDAEPHQEPSADAPSEATPSPTPQPDETMPDDGVDPHNGWWPIGDDTYERTFHTSGGTAVIQLSPDHATLVSASPSRGHTAMIDQGEQHQLSVYFAGRGSTYVVDAQWQNGEPHGEISES